MSLSVIQRIGRLVNFISRLGHLFTKIRLFPKSIGDFFLTFPLSKNALLILLL